MKALLQTACVMANVYYSFEYILRFCFQYLKLAVLTSLGLLTGKDCILQSMNQNPKVTAQNSASKSTVNTDVIYPITKLKPNLNQSPLEKPVVQQAQQLV